MKPAKRITGRRVRELVESRKSLLARYGVGQNVDWGLNHVEHILWNEALLRAYVAAKGPKVRPWNWLYYIPRRQDGRTAADEELDLMLSSAEPEPRGALSLSCRTPYTVERVREMLRIAASMGFTAEQFEDSVLRYALACGLSPESVLHTLDVTS